MKMIVSRCRLILRLDAALEVHVTLYVVNCGGIWGNRGKRPHGVNTHTLTLFDVKLSAGFTPSDRRI